MKKLLICLAVIGIALSMFCISGCGNKGASTKSKEEDKQDSLSDALESINVDNVKVTVTHKEMDIAYITVELPDYMEIFSKVCNEDDYEQAIIDIINNGEYDMVQHKTTADITIDNGVETIHTDAAVDKLMKKELIAAINFVTEEE